MTERFDRCLAVTLQFEGGYVDHPKDPGGATNMGITFAVLQKWMGRPITKQDVKNIDAATVKAIYRKNYWYAAGCNDLYAGVDLAVFDASVNSGVSRGRKWLMASVGSSDHSVTVKRICAKRLGFVSSLKTWSTFGKGWARRIATIEATGVKWALEAMGLNTTRTESKLREEELKADKLSGAQTVGGAGSGVAGGSGGLATGTGDVPVNVPEAALNPAFLWVGITLLLITAGYLLWRAHINRQRSIAYNAAVHQEA